MRLFPTLALVLALALAACGQPAGTSGGKPGKPDTFRNIRVLVGGDAKTRTALHLAVLHEAQGLTITGHKVGLAPDAVDGPIFNFQTLAACEPAIDSLRRLLTRIDPAVTITEMVCTTRKTSSIKRPQ